MQIKLKFDCINRNDYYHNEDWYIGLTLAVDST